MDWCRLWHDAPDDPKWRLIARKAGCRAGDVWAVFTRMMVRASASGDRGSIAGWDDEVEAVALDFEPHEVAAIREAMRGRVLDGDVLSGWSKRQPKRERQEPSGSSTERVREHRERQKAQETAIVDDVTPCNASNGHETPRLDKSREEKKERKSTDENSSAGEPARVVQAVETSEAEVFRVGKDVLGRNAGGMIANLRKAQHFDDRAALDLIEQARAKNDPREWMGAVLRGDARPRTPEHILFPPDIYRNVL